MNIKSRDHINIPTVKSTDAKIMNLKVKELNFSRIRLLYSFLHASLSCRIFCYFEEWIMKLWRIILKLNNILSDETCSSPTTAAVSLSFPFLHASLMLTVSHYGCLLFCVILKCMTKLMTPPNVVSLCNKTFECEKNLPYRNLQTDNRGLL